jgi:hypothetical protein
MMEGLLRSHFRFGKSTVSDLKCLCGTADLLKEESILEGCCKFIIASLTDDPGTHTPKICAEKYPWNERAACPQ